MVSKARATREEVPSGWPGDALPAGPSSLPEMSVIPSRGRLAAGGQVRHATPRQRRRQAVARCGASG